MARRGTDARSAASLPRRRVGRECTGLGAASVHPNCHHIMTNTLTNAACYVGKVVQVIRPMFVEFPRPAVTTFRACLVDCNRRCNIIVIPIV